MDMCLIKRSFIYAFIRTPNLVERIEPARQFAGMRRFSLYQPPAYLKIYALVHEEIGRFRRVYYKL